MYYKLLDDRKERNILLDTIQAPRKHISRQAINVWRLSSLLSNGSTILLLMMLYLLHRYFSWPPWIGILLLLLLAYMFLKSIYRLLVYPTYMQKTWCYDIDPAFIQLKFGFLQTHHIIIPMNRIEYVDMHDGALLRKFRVSNITIGTIASSYQIPAVDVDDAKALRDFIVYYAQLHEDSGDKDA